MAALGFDKTTTKAADEAIILQQYVVIGVSSRMTGYPDASQDWSLWFSARPRRRSIASGAAARDDYFAAASRTCFTAEQTGRSGLQ
jgi:hypothetical protein